MNEELKHLNWLSNGFYAYAGLTFLFSLFPIIHLSIGIAMITGAFPGTNDGPPPPVFIGWFFTIFAALFILFGMAVAFCNFLAARYLKQQKNYTFCFVIGAVDCMFAPLGTVLGVFTILTLLKDPVKALFGKAAPPELQSVTMAPPDWR